MILLHSPADLDGQRAAAIPKPVREALQPSGATLADLLEATMPDSKAQPDTWPDAFEWVDQITLGLFLGFLLRGNDYGYLVLVHAGAEGFDPATAAAANGEDQPRTDNSRSPVGWPELDFPAPPAAWLPARFDNVLVGTVSPSRRPDSAKPFLREHQDGCPSKSIDI